jgi:hypothetical protein
LAKSVKSVKERVSIASRAGKMTAVGRELCVSLTADSVAFTNSFIEFFTQFYPTTKKRPGSRMPSSGTFALR